MVSSRAVAPTRRDDRTGAAALPVGQAAGLLPGELRRCQGAGSLGDLKPLASRGLRLGAMARFTFGFIAIRRADELFFMAVTPQTSTRGMPSAL